jgi:hypothetical protein
MSKLFHRSIELAVREDTQHTPASFLYGGRREKVEQVLKHWRVARGWWGKAIEREYFQVRTEAGIVCELYRALPGGPWYLQRIYD